ncbi:DUF1993 domain-containing protein [Qipengyuania marisflavi]|uniref:DUF1993 domain-containing protein n=1 Tax=Qipengyuania marisflavi TaxID=2486356 RepID=A0A5S3P0F5_9SPHN|nr:DUF1993 domain-containing protein [Qipengyuania marisflavi]TMM46202.1 DUF1993 domain-containing protein [Qipengyuania marisflavi]
MPLTLHAAIIPNWLQSLGATARLLDRAEQWSGEAGMSEGEILGARLADDMLPLAYQFTSCCNHSAYAIERCREGHFTPQTNPPPMKFAELRAMVQEAIGTLTAVTPQELEDIAGNDMIFSFGETMRLEFTVQDFLLSFSNPNLFFHAATAYDILRMKGMPLSKRDFMGAARVKQG